MSETVAGLKIRPMALDDIPVVHALDVISFSLPWTERSLVYEVSQNTASRNWVAEFDSPEGNCIIGMLVLWLILDEAHIATLAVHPDYRRRGIARRIMVTALNAVIKEGACSSKLEVRAGNQAALHMYQELGYKVVGRRNRYYHDNQEDAILLTLEPLHIMDPEIGR